MPYYVSALLCEEISMQARKSLNLWCITSIVAQCEQNSIPKHWFHFHAKHEQQRVSLPPSHYNNKIVSYFHDLYNKQQKKQPIMDHFEVKGQKRKASDASERDSKRIAIRERESDDDPLVTLSHNPPTLSCHASQPGLNQEVTYHHIYRLYSFCC